MFGRGIAKALQCFANEIWSNGSEYSHKSIDDMVGSSDEARVLDMLVLFRAMDIACSFLHPTRSRPHHPSYNAMNLSQEELDVSHFPHSYTFCKYSSCQGLGASLYMVSNTQSNSETASGSSVCQFSSRSSTGSHVFSLMGGNLAKNNLSAGLARSLHTLHFVREYIQIHRELFSF